MSNAEVGEAVTMSHALGTRDSDDECVKHYTNKCFTIVI